MNVGRTLLAIPLLSTLALGPQDPEPTPRPTRTSFVERERKRLEEELIGAWALVSMNLPGRTFDQQRGQGFAIFAEGFLSITIRAQALEPGVLGEELVLYYQAGVHRYRVNEFLRLQTATAIGFDNMNREAELEFVRSGRAREHPIQLQGDQLTLRNEDGASLVFRRVHAGTFPKTAIEALRRSGGKSPDDED